MAQKDFGADRRRLQGMALAASELVSELDKRFQFKPPPLDAPERKIWRDAGARDVVEWLLTLRDEARGSDPMGKVLGPQ
jgi:hypothetical protein